MKIKTKVKSNMRSLPSTTSTILGLADSGRIMEAEQVEGGWYKCTFYLSSSVVQLLGENPDHLIPYYSQWDLDANKRPNDCGQCCVKMVSASHGIDVQTNKLPYQSNQTGISNGNDLVRNFDFVGLNARSLNLGVDEKPKTGDICLVNYGGFNRGSVQDKKMTSLHWLVYLGENEDTVTVHDPDWSGALREKGASKVYSMNEWKKAFLTLSRNVVRVV